MAVCLLRGFTAVVTYCHRSAISWMRAPRAAVTASPACPESSPAAEACPSLTSWRAVRGLGCAEGLGVGPRVGRGGLGKAHREGAFAGRASAQAHVGFLRLLWQVVCHQLGGSQQGLPLSRFWRPEARKQGVGGAAAPTPVPGSVAEAPSSLQWPGCPALRGCVTPGLPRACLHLPPPCMHACAQVSRDTFCGDHHPHPPPA